MASPDFGEPPPHARLPDIVVTPSLALSNGVCLRGLAALA